MIYNDFSVLANKGLFSLFVPSNDAFRALPAGTLDSLMANPKKLRQLVLNHLLPNALFVDVNTKVPASGFLKTAGGSFLPFRKTADGQMLVGTNSAKVFLPNRPGNNGVNHLVDKVIMLDEY